MTGAGAGCVIVGIVSATNDNLFRLEGIVRQPLASPVASRPRRARKSACDSNVGGSATLGNTPFVEPALHQSIGIPKAYRGVTF